MSYLNDDASLEQQIADDRHDAEQCDADAFDQFEATRRDQQMRADADRNVLPVRVARRINPEVTYAVGVQRTMDFALAAIGGAR